MHNHGFVGVLGGNVARWFSARRPLSEKVDRQVSRGYTAEMAAHVVEEGVLPVVSRTTLAGRMAG